MDIKFSNDDINVTNVNKSSAVQKIAATRDLPAHGNNLPVETKDSASDKNASEAVDDEKLDEAVRNINQHIQAVQRELHFSVDKDSGITVIKVMDLATKEVIRQIPNEEALTVARRLGEGAGLELFSEYG